jgi:predicted outer membrane lipoprotein
MRAFIALLLGLLLAVANGILDALPPARLVR